MNPFFIFITRFRIGLVGKTVPESFRIYKYMCIIIDWDIGPGMSWAELDLWTNSDDKKSTPVKL